MTAVGPYRPVRHLSGRAVGHGQHRGPVPAGGHRAPAMTLVGVVVHDPDKAGRMPASCAGSTPTACRPPRAIDEVLALDADCVLYMPQGCDVDVLCALLGVGVNVVTTRGEFHHPASMDPGRPRPDRGACMRRGGSSIHSTGAVRVHLRGGTPRPDLHPAAPRRVGDRGVRRSVPAELPRVALLPHGLRPRSGHVRPRPLGPRSPTLFGPSLRVLGDALSAPRLGRRQRRGRHRPPSDHDRGGRHRGGDRGGPDA